MSETHDNGAIADSAAVVIKRFLRMIDRCLDLKRQGERRREREREMLLDFKMERVRRTIPVPRGIKATFANRPVCNALGWVSLCGWGFCVSKQYGGLSGRGPLTGAGPRFLLSLIQAVSIERHEGVPG